MDRFADEIFEKKLKELDGDGVDGEDDEDIYDDEIGDEGNQNYNYK